MNDYCRIINYLPDYTSWVVLIINELSSWKEVMRFAWEDLVTALSTGLVKFVIEWA